MKLVDTVDLKFTPYLMGIGSSPIVSKKDFIRFKKMNSKTTNIQLQELNSLSLNLKLNISQMLLANVHLGHRKKFLDIKIKPYLLGYRSNIYILNLTYTLLQFKILVALIVNLISLRQKFLIVKDRDLFKFREFLKLRNVFYYDKKWTGGVLTNYKKVRHSEKFKLENNTYNSLKALRYMPSLTFFFDADLSHWALIEAVNLEIPISAVIDTNISLLAHINYPIVGNNKAFEAVFLYLHLIRNAALKGRQKELLKILLII